MIEYSDAAIASEIFGKLASEMRCSILFLLYEKPASESALVKQLDTTPQDVSRNIRGLMEGDLVKKEEREFYLTEFGKIVTKQIAYFILIKRLSNFLEDHTISQLPDKFLQRIAVLGNCQMITRVTAVFERLKKLEMSATKQLKLVVPQAWVDEGNILVNRA
ncbi:MAG: helix-turn-helix domain-containing protein, partial [Thermoproteota archaeon]|nr:helix-turn-helix domain-containing protein [Thermoproteota archaeon]